MANAFERFFAAWGASDADRDAMIRDAVADTVAYVDPRGSVEGPDDLCAYVAQFSANAPGSAAEVSEQSAVGGVHSIQVRFFGTWGEQFGRYEGELDADGKIAKLNGVPEPSA